LRTERPVPGPLASRWTSQQSARGTLTRRRRRKLRAAEPARSSGGRRGAYRTSELAQVAPPGVASPRAGKPTLGFPLRWRTALRSKDDEHSIRRRNTSTSSTSARRTGRWAGCTRIGFGPANRGRAHSSRRCAHGWTSRRTQQAGVCARPCESPGSTANRRAGTDPASSEPSVCADGGVEAAAPAAASKLVRATSRGEVISSPGKPGDGAWPQASVLRRRGGVSRPQTSPPPHREPPDEPGSARCRGRSHRRTGTGSVLIGLEQTSGRTPRLASQPVGMRLERAATRQRADRDHELHGRRASDRGERRFRPGSQSHNRASQPCSNSLVEHDFRKCERSPGEPDGVSYSQWVELHFTSAGACLHLRQAEVKPSPMSTGPIQRPDIDALPASRATRVPKERRAELGGRAPRAFRPAKARTHTPEVCIRRTGRNPHELFPPPRHSDHPTWAALPAARS
jgi:hypothetical protein